MVVFVEKIYNVKTESGKYISTYDKKKKKTKKKVIKKEEANKKKSIKSKKIFLQV